MLADRFNSLHFIMLLQKSLHLQLLNRMIFNYLTTYDQTVVMRIILTIMALVCAWTMTYSQNIDELKTMQAEKKAIISDLQSQIDAAQTEVNSLQKEIDKLSGWRKGFSGIVGFDINNSNNWAANPNPDASSTALNIGLTGFANRVGEKYFWNNKAVVTKSWQDVDIDDTETDDLFDNGTVDIVNLQSLYGYKLNDKLAISAMGDMNTSLWNFLNPGVLDLGLGVTWLPSANMTVVVHPFNYHLAFSGVDGVSTEGAVGAKIRADYNQAFSIGGKKVNWNSTLMSFIPYQSNEPTLFEYTWLNTLTFELWKGIGVGVGFGLRNAEFESESTQSFSSLGLSYTL